MSPCQRMVGRDMLSSLREVEARTGPGVEHPGVQEGLTLTSGTVADCVPLLDKHPGGGFASFCIKGREGAAPWFSGTREGHAPSWTAHQTMGKIRFPLTRPRQQRSAPHGD